MIKQLAPTLDPRQKADLIYRSAQSELAGRLWRAALGSSFGPEQAALPGEQAQPPGGVDSLLAMLIAEHQETPARPAPIEPRLTPAAEAVDAPSPPQVTRVEPDTFAAPGLGPNARHAAAIEQAAQRTNMPPAVLAAIVDAEAAKGRDGGWKLYSRNPRSSAAGLGQFLAGTWRDEAERPGTWLNQTARANGWLTQGGKVEHGARGDLLALRYDGTASINAIADYARANLDRLRKAGIAIEQGVQGTARAAYLGHHLGVGDAIKFFKAGLGASHARKLLQAQVGAASAARQIASAGDAASAHRAWLLGFVDRKIRPERFQA